MPRHFRSCSNHSQHTLPSREPRLALFALPVVRAAASETTLGSCFSCVLGAAEDVRCPRRLWSF